VIGSGRQAAPSQRSSRFAAPMSRPVPHKGRQTQLQSLMATSVATFSVPGLLDLNKTIRQKHEKHLKTAVSGALAPAKRQ
jgi:hypothetical protein